MSAKSIKLILIICLLSGILLCVLGCASVIPFINLKGNPNSLPVRSVTITIDANQRNELFTQLRKFADKHSLKFILTFFSAKQDSFLVTIYGDGFHLSADAASISQREISIDFYNEGSTPTPQGTIDALFSDLKSFLGEIPNVTIIDQP